MSPAAERNKHTHKEVVINTHTKKLSTIFPWPELVKQRHGRACLRLYSQLLPAARHLQLPDAGSAHKLVCHTTTPAKKSPTSSQQLEVVDFKNAATGFRCLNTCVLLSCTCESHWCFNTSLEIKLYTVTYLMEEPESIWAPILSLFKTWLSKDILTSFTGHFLYEIRLSNNCWLFFSF